MRIALKVGLHKRTLLRSEREKRRDKLRDAVFLAALQKGLVLNGGKVGLDVIEGTVVPSQNVPIKLAHELACRCPLMVHICSYLLLNGKAVKSSFQMSSLPRVSEQSRISFLCPSYWKFQIHTAILPYGILFHFVVTRRQTYQHLFL